jgi:hypothetical protein
MLLFISYFSSNFSLPSALGTTGGATSDSEQKVRKRQRRRDNGPAVQEGIVYLH